MHDIFSTFCPITDRMIKFFRKIRQQLLSENKFRKYLLYAIGEIILVVIGILIALQINTWNNNKQRHALELETLHEIKEALAQDTLVLRKNILRLEEKSRSSQVLIEHVENKRPYIADLDEIMMDVYYHRGYNTFNNAAFELLKERGFDIIQNTELRKSITKHYTTDLADISGLLSRLNQLNLIQADNIYDDFRLTDGKIQPYDYLQMLNDPRVFGPFYHFALMIDTYRDNLTRFKVKTATLLQLVDTELSKRKSAVKQN